MRQRRLLAIVNPERLRRILRRLFADNLRRYLDGQPLLNVVDRARGY